jgi:hypothetical protein
MDSGEDDFQKKQMDRPARIAGGAFLRNLFCEAKGTN